MAIWKSLAVALAFDIASTHAIPCKSASSATLSDAVSFTSVSMSAINASNFPFSSVIPAPTRTTSTLKRSTTATTEIRSDTAIRTTKTDAVPVRKITAISTSQPQSTAINLLRNPGFDDSSDIFFSQPWVLRSSQGNSVAEFKDNYPVRSEPTALYMSILGDGTPSIEQWVAGLEKSKQYILSTWVAYESGAEGCHVDLKLGKTLVKRHVISKGSPGQYEKVEGLGASSFQMALVSMWLYCPSGATVAILADDFSFEEV